MSYETFVQRSRKIRQILNEQFGVQKMCPEVVQEHEIRNVTRGHHMWRPECDRRLMSPTTWVLFVPRNTWNVINRRELKASQNGVRDLYVIIHALRYALHSRHEPASRMKPSLQYRWNN